MNYFKKYLKYKKKYISSKKLQIGGSKEITWNSDYKKNKYKTLVTKLGNPTTISRDFKTDDVIYVEWKLNRSKNKYGHFGNLDMIQLRNDEAIKRHPEPAPVYIIVGKYINVPDNLLGPIKYASETINVEQLFVPIKTNQHFKDTGIKKVALVTGSCSSVTISAITIHFVEDMIKKYKNRKTNIEELNDIFRKEYDTRILNYLCGKGIVPDVEWLSPSDFGEENIFNGNFEQCKNIENESN
tara:strand:+ start:4355 stop:5077 length:723 start_codon:yes stop_codon:yes gene_type:complete